MFLVTRDVKMIKIKNKVLVNEVVFCRSLLSKAIGLMFTRKIKDKGLIFVFDKEMIQCLHMFFVFYSIDVLFLDKEKKVVDMKKEFRPFTLYSSKKKAKYVIELPSGTIKDIKIGEKLEF